MFFPFKIIEFQKYQVNNFRLFSGTIERILKWAKVYKQFALYEVIGDKINVKELFLLF